MKRIIYILAMMLTVGMGASAQTLIERSDGTFTQGDQYLAALKTLSIPYGVAPTFDGGLERNGSLFFNTTTNKLMVWTGEDWEDVGKDTDLSDYYNKSEVDALIAPFATTADMNAALALKVNTNTTVNGKALSGNITIEQSDIPGLVAALDAKLNLTGGTVTGVIKSPAPVADEDLANKAYVDSKASPFNTIDVTQQLHTDKAINVIPFDNTGMTYSEGSIDFGITRTTTHTMGFYAFKQGSETTASGQYSSAFGSNTTASGVGSSAFGRRTTASSNYSSAFGDQTTASGQGSSAFGFFTTASNSYSSAFGSNTTASGQYSSAFGSNTTASGTYSSAFGTNNSANEFASLSIGRYSTGGSAQTSWVAGSPIFKVGNGTSAANRRNAYVLYNDGRSEQIKDVEVTQIGQGFVLKSPNGTRWRITVDNSGNLTTTSL